MKKYKKTISILLSVFLLLNLFMLNYSTNKYEAKADTITNVTQLVPINILEIQPGYSFELNQNTFNSVLTQNYPNSKWSVNLTQMSMAQFISTNDYMNGKYDIVYIGDKLDGTVDYTKEGTKISQFNFSNASLSDYQFSTNQYYSENDITYKRAGFPLEPAQQKYSTEAGLKTFIESKQLMIMSDKIFTKINLNGTKLYNNFINYKINNSEFPNFKLVDKNNDDAITEAKVLNFYSQTNISKRPTLRLKSAPMQFDSTNDNSYLNDRLLEFKFDLLKNSSNSGDMTVKLFLDIDGDSLYREEECVRTEIINDSTVDYGLSYELNENFYGLMPWKLELTENSTGAKSYKMGGFAFRGQPLVIRLLQIVPENNTLNIEYNASGSNYLTQPLYATGKYIIKVTRISIKNFKVNYPNPTTAQAKFTYDNNGNKVNEPLNNVPTSLNGNYDMVLIGFSDMINQQSIAGADTKTSTAANPVVAEAIKSFIATGQSVMFTHDTISGFINWGFNNAKDFKDIVGQSRFRDKFNNNELNPDNTKVPHETPVSAGNEGFTKGIVLTGSYGYTNASKINDGVITGYPYVLGNIKVATTHLQYHQLNLEDENIIPWYTLNADDKVKTNESYFDKYDARNAYYTYSKGNITFSGTGHSRPNTSVAEQQLFINTIIKASRSANHAPTVKINNLTTGQTVTKTQERLNFTITVNDIDLNESLSADVYINDTKVQAQIGQLTSGRPSSVSIPQSELSRVLTTQDDFTLKVVAKDVRGATGDDDIRLKYNFTVPSANISSDEDIYGALKGDTINVNLEVLAQNGDNVEANLHFNNEINPILDNSSVAELVSGGKWALSDIVFAKDTKPNPEKQQRALSFIAKEVGRCTVNDSMRYILDLPNETEQSKPVNFPIDVREGRIVVNISEPTVTVRIKVLKDNIEVASGQTTNGTITFNGLTSGQYTVKVDAKADEIAVANNNQTVDLSYNNPSPRITFNLTGRPEKPTLTTSTVEPTREPVKVYTDFHGVPFAQISRDNGQSWRDYVDTPTDYIEVTENCKIYARSRNEAGLYSPLEECIINNIDNTAPTASLILKTIDNKEYSSSGWTNKNIVAILSNIHDNKTAYDDLTVTATIRRQSDTTATEVTLVRTTDENGQNIAQYEFNVPDNEEWSGSITFFVTDEAGNQYTSNTRDVNIDKIAPSATLSIKTVDNVDYSGTGYTNKNVKFQFTAFDAQSTQVSGSYIYTDYIPNGTATGNISAGEFIEDSNNDNKIVSYTTNYETIDGTFRYTFTLRDRAGNIFTFSEKTVLVDTVRPIIQITATDEKKGKRLTATSDEPVYFIEPVTTTGLVSTIEYFTDKKDTIVFKGKDKAGNEDDTSTSVDMLHRER